MPYCIVFSNCGEGIPIQRIRFSQMHFTSPTSRWLAPNTRTSEASENTRVRVSKLPCRRCACTSYDRNEIAYYTV